MTVKYKKNQINEICSQLKKGKIIAFPTDTVFGLGCIMKPEISNKIYLAKGRDFNKPLPVMCSDIDMLKSIAYTDEKSEMILNSFSPGPITVVLKGKKQETIAIRIPDDEWILKLISKMKEPLYVTSANISDHGSLLNAEDVFSEMNGRIDGIVMDDSSGKEASTIISFVDGVKILRSGPIKKQEIEKVLNESII